MKQAGIDTKTILFMCGRPTRETIIGEDDINNLKIAMNTAATWEDFFALV